MTRQRSGTNWSQLRSLIESSLQQQPDFQRNFRLEGKIRVLGAGLDLAIVTRGVRRPFGVANGLQRLVMFYNEEAEQQIPPSAVIVHELLLHLHWLAESQTENRPGGHGPEHYAELLGAILRRAPAFGSQFLTAY